MPFSRRDFLSSTLAGSVAFGLSTNAPAQNSAADKNAAKRAAKLPIIICAANGYSYLDQAYALLAGGGDTLDAALRVVKGPENDPNDDTRRARAAFPMKKALSNSMPAACTGLRAAPDRWAAYATSRMFRCVSKAVMEHTGHVMLVGEGAERFAVAMGFPRENLLTEQSRKIWLLWKETNSTDDWWGPGWLIRIGAAGIFQRTPQPTNCGKRIQRLERASRQSLASTRNFAWLRSITFCSRQLEPFTVPR